MEFENVIRCRKSVRRFDSRQIAKEDVQKLVFAAMAAPISSKRYQDINITVIQKAEILNQMEEMIVGIDHAFYGAKTVILLSSKEQEVPRVEEFNVGCVMENMLLEATNLGLGGIYLSFFLTRIEKMDEFKELLGIPKGFEPLSAIGVGYPVEEDKALPRTDILGRMNVDYI